MMIEIICIAAMLAGTIGYNQTGNTLPWLIIGIGGAAALARKADRS